jgi:hypothetical protein
MGLSNGFLIHRGIKTRKEATQNRSEKQTLSLVKRQIYPEITKVFGKKKECQMI